MDGKVAASVVVVDGTERRIVPEQSVARENVRILHEGRRAVKGVPEVHVAVPGVDCGDARGQGWAQSSRR
jgi:hypothetical protein